MSQYITVSDFKIQYPDADVSKYADTTISGMITRASERVDSFVEYSFDSETITDELSDGNIDEDSNIVFFPRKRPIIDLTALAIVKGSTTIDINLTDGSDSNIYNIPEAGDKVYIPLSIITVNSVSVINFYSLRTTNFMYKASYTCGYDDIPYEVQDATGLYVLELMSKGQNLAGASMVSQGGISISYRGNSKGKSDFVLDAERLLTRYRKVSGF